MKSVVIKLENGAAFHRKMPLSLEDLETEIALKYIENESPKIFLFKGRDINKIIFKKKVTIFYEVSPIDGELLYYPSEGRIKFEITHEIKLSRNLLKLKSNLIAVRHNLHNMIIDFNFSVLKISVTLKEGGFKIAIGRETLWFGENESDFVKMFDVFKKVMLMILFSREKAILRYVFDDMDFKRYVEGMLIYEGIIAFSSYNNTIAIGI